MGRRIWVVNTYDGNTNVYDCRVLSFSKFLPAGPVGEGEPNSKGGIRTKHLVKLWTDPGGTRVLTVGSIRLKDPGRVTGAIQRAARERAEADD